jgi:hypothetical protein
VKDFKLILEDWRRFGKKIEEQEEVEAEAEEEVTAEQPPAEAPEEAPAEAPEEAPEEAATDLPPLTWKTSFSVFKGNAPLAAQVMNELLKGGDYFKQLQIAGGEYPIQLDALKNWVNSIGGVNVFAKRAAFLGGKIPENGLDKSKMPFLPLPKDKKSVAKNPEDVKDALTPGGTYNVDMMEKVEAPKPNTFVGMDQPGAKEFMTGGHEKFDNVPDDDVIQITMGGEISPASAAVPTQTNILFPKGLGMAISGDGGKPIVGGDLGAYASLKDELLDGHHRWAATMLNDPSASIGTMAKIDLEKLGTYETLEYLTAIGNALGNKTKIKEGRIRRKTKVSEARMRKRVRKMLRSKTKVSEVQIRETVRKMFTGE